MDGLVLLPEEEAVRVYFDGRNARALFRLLVFFTTADVVGALVMLASERPVGLALALVMLVVIRVLYRIRERDAFNRYFRPLLLGFLTAQLVLLRQLVPPATPVSPMEFLLLPTLLFFRLRWPALAVPVGALWAASIGRHLVEALWRGAPVETAGVVVHTALSVLVLWFVDRLTRLARHAFVADWRRENRRHHERRRMREEIADARKIQLSMLPRSDPRVPWLDVAGISIPASEVGGDYYDYFAPAPGRQSVVVADVAGHGVASGLLLSGIRSCLYLLQETPLEPIEILAKLDRMVRLTTGRFFVTMLYAVFDERSRTVTFSAAGHPPLLHYRAADGDVVEHALPCLPLGTALGSSLQQKVVDYGPGDVFLLYTDGIAETLDGRRELYGTERLRLRLRDTDHGRTAQEIRNTLLGDVVNFKGDAQQTDDITLVVVKPG